MNDLTELAYIYGLADPLTGEIGYVGRSVTPQSRYRAHCGSQRFQLGQRRIRWIEQLRTAGRQPMLTILACVPKASAEQAEHEWIAKMRAQRQASGNCMSEDRRVSGRVTMPRQRPVSNKQTYLLRTIDDKLWARMKARAARDGLPLRKVLLALVEAYVSGQITVRQTGRIEVTHAQLS